MANLNDRVDAEFENIERVLKELPSAARLSSLSHLELGGVAALLHNFYNGVENVLKQIISSKGINIPRGEKWHTELLDLALKHKRINKTTRDSLKRFLGFRHFFVHGYALNLDVDRMRPLVKAAPRVFDSIKKSIQKSLI